MKNITVQQAKTSTVSEKKLANKMSQLASMSIPLFFLLHALPSHAADPVIQIPPNVSFQSGSDVVFSAANGNPIVITDPDNAGSGFIVTVSVPAADGVLALGSTANLTSLSGNNTSTIELRGPIATLQTALDGLTLSVADDCVCDSSLALDISATRVTEVGFLNPGIEAPEVINVSFAQVIEAEVPGWSTDASDDLIEIWTSGFQGVVSHSGQQHMEVNATEVADLFQVFTPSAAGVPLVFRFAHRGRETTDTLNVTITDMGADGAIGGGDDAILLNQNYSTSEVAWVEYTDEAGTSTGNPLQVTFDSSPFGGGSIGNFIDSVLIIDASESADSSLSLAEDSDNDGIPDAVENAASIQDMDGDALNNSLDADSDGDGLSDTLEAGADFFAPVDTDDDGNPDFLDLDSDNDGIPDAVEAGEDPANPLDSDNDGDLDFREEDSDDDGISDTDEAGSDPANPADENENGIPDFQESTESGTPAEDDSDSDGIPDSVEGTDDSDGDGITNNLDIDSDNDGLLDGDEAGDGDEPADTDGDGVADYLDLDSDNDGLTDTFEAGGADADNDGVVDDFVDNDSDGHDDAVGVMALPAGDVDSDGIADWQDIDSDNDGLTDVFETLGSDFDLDGDGRIDGFFDANADGLTDELVNDGNVNAAVDTDADGAFNHLDLDSDNDTLSDLQEVGGTDNDGDGEVDQWLDDDDDGIPDSVDTDFQTGEDADSDGIIDEADADITGETDTDGDGIIDLFDDDPTGSGFIAIDDEPLSEASLPDGNGNGIPDVLELDPDAQAGGETTGGDIADEGAIRTGLDGVGCSIGGTGQTNDPLLAALALLSTAWLFVGRFTRRRISLAVRPTKGE